MPLELKKQINFFIIVSRSVARGVIRSSEGKVWYTAYSEEKRTGRDKSVCICRVYCDTIYGFAKQVRRSGGKRETYTRPLLLRLGTEGTLNE